MFICIQDKLGSVFEYIMWMMTPFCIHTNDLAEVTCPGET